MRRLSCKYEEHDDICVFDYGIKISLPHDRYTTHSHNSFHFNRSKGKWADYYHRAISQVPNHGSDRRSNMDIRALALVSNEALHSHSHLHIGSSYRTVGDT